MQKRGGGETNTLAFFQPLLWGEGGEGGGGFHPQSGWGDFFVSGGPPSGGSLWPGGRW